MYRIEAAEREKRLKERQAAKLLRKLQLAELRAKAGSRATGEHRRQVERDKEAEERKRWEGEELRRMRGEEAAQLAGGDRYIHIKGYEIFGTTPMSRKSVHTHSALSLDPP